MGFGIGHQMDAVLHQISEAKIILMLHEQAVIFLYQITQASKLLWGQLLSQVLY